MSQMNEDMMALASLSAGRSVVVKPLLKYPRPEMTWYAGGQHNKSLGTQKYLEKERMKYGSSDDADAMNPDWRGIVATMLATTPKTTMWKGDVVRAVVGATLLDELLSGVDRNIWEIYSRTGCTMDVYPHSKEERDKTNGQEAGYVVLSGDSNAVRQAMTEIRTLAQCAALTDTTATLRPLGPDEALKIRLTAEGRFTTAYGEKPSHIPALQGRCDAKGLLEEHATIPAEWTQRSLLNYIAQLAFAHLSQNKTFTLYGTPQARDESRLELMHKAFAAPEARHAVSIAAFKRAIYSALMSGPHKRPHMRILFSKMVDLQLMPDTDVFNMFLEDATKHKDLRKFRSVLWMMANYGCVPNLQSWMQLLRLVEHEEAKRHILRSMHSIGLLYDSRALRSVAREMVFFDAHRAMQGYEPYDERTTNEFINEKKPPDDLLTSMDSSSPYQQQDAPNSPTQNPRYPNKSNVGDLSIPEFISQLEKHYGPNWASVAAIRHIVNVFCMFGRFSAVSTFLARMGWNYKRDPVVYNIILSRARTLGRWKPMLQTLHAMAQAGVPVDEIGYTQLFAFARKVKWPNTQAIVWAYACIADRTTMHMRAAVSCQLRYPGCSMTKSFHVFGLQSEYVVPALVPRELASRFAEASSIAAIRTRSRSPNPYWFSSAFNTDLPPSSEAPSNNPIAMRKLGATLVEIFRQEIQIENKKRLVPCISLIDMLTKAYTWDQKLLVKSKKEAATIRLVTNQNWPTLEIPLRTKGTGPVVRTLTIPVVRAKIVRSKSIKNRDKLLQGERGEGEVEEEQEQQQ
ncbi:hypothetical protein CFO_g1723 [Ceratocystis platani]|uniref:Uncharacterized protein n=1 Tax=Ceratocystis fimbriata f. sp. platani TaxID=88771 RepID=A0A0F8CZ59_CERFI|nr:hypothetical protein CFO_g1723 [Ceratocystis platani]